MMFSGVPALVPHIQSGRMRAIGIGSLKRFPALPEVPTFDESGPEGLRGDHLVRPAWRRSRRRRRSSTRWNVEVGKILASADIKERFLNDGLEPMGGSPEEFGKFIRAEIDKYAKVIKAAGMTAQQ